MTVGLINQSLFYSNIRTLLFQILPFTHAHFVTVSKIFSTAVFQTFFALFFFTFFFLSFFENLKLLSPL